MNEGSFVALRLKLDTRAKRILLCKCLGPAECRHSVRLQVASAVVPVRPAGACWEGVTQGPHAQENLALLALKASTNSNQPNREVLTRPHMPLRLKPWALGALGPWGLGLGQVSTYHLPPESCRAEDWSCSQPAKPCFEGACHRLSAEEVRFWEVVGCSWVRWRSG